MADKNETKYRRATKSIRPIGQSLMDADSGRVLYLKEEEAIKAYGKHHKDYDLHRSTGAYDR